MQIEVEAVPDPGALSLFGLGLLGAAYLGRVRRRFKTALRYNPTECL